MHPDLAALAPLLGTWSGHGAGKYPTIEPFDYFEEAVFSHVGKPFLAYSHKTKAVADGKPLHAEAGFLRVPEPGRVELILAHPSGITEIDTGTYSLTGGVIEIAVSTTAIGRAPTAKEVTGLPVRCVSTATSCPTRCRWARSDNRCRIIWSRCCVARAEQRTTSVTPQGVPRRVR